MATLIGGSKTGPQTLVSSGSSERSRVRGQDERLLKPRVISALLLFFLAIAAALAAPERESELGAPTAAYESERFESAN